MERLVRSVFPAAILGLAVALCSCSAPIAPPPSDTASPETVSRSATAPSNAVPSTTAPSTTEPSTAPVSGDSASAAALTTFSGSWEDVQFSFDHPSDWNVEDTTAAAAGMVSVMGPDGKEMASLTILPFREGGVCMPEVCNERPAVYLGDWAGQAPLSLSGHFVVRSLAMDLAPFPEDRSRYGWSDNVRLVTSMYSDTGQPFTSGMPGELHGEGRVETGVVAFNGLTQRFVLFGSGRDFGTLGEARGYTGTDEHRQIQAMIASFRESR